MVADHSRDEFFHRSVHLCPSLRTTDHTDVYTALTWISFRVVHRDMNIEDYNIFLIAPLEFG